MQPIRTTDYRELSKVHSPSIARDGTIAFVETTPSGDQSYESSIYTIQADESERQEFITVGNAGQPAWSPSGDRLAFVSARESDRGQVWIAPADGGEATQVTTVFGGVTAIQWSPDGERIAFLQEVEPPEMERDLDLDAENDYEYESTSPDPRVLSRLVYRLEPGARPTRGDDAYFNEARTQVYVVELKTGEVKRATAVDYDHYAPSWGDSDTLYFLGKYDDDDGVDYEVLAWDRESGETESLTDVSIHPNTVPTLSAASDGRVAFSSDPAEPELMPQTEIEVYDPETGESAFPTEPLDRKPTHSQPFHWDGDEETLFFMVDDEGGKSLVAVPADASESPYRVVSETDINGTAVGGGKVAFTQSEWDHPGDVFVQCIDEDEPTRLTNVNSDYLADRQVLEPEELWHDNGEGDQIQSWILTPPDFDPEETYPVIVEVHGGPSPVMWTTSGTMWHEFQLLAQEGYIVFWQNPRGSTGYGKEFMRAVRRDWGGPFYRDVMAGVDLLTERDYVDEENLFITGGSYGGYMTAWTITQTDRFRAAVAQRGVYDFRTMYGTTSFPQLMDWYYGVKPWEDPQLYLDHSPAAQAHHADTPLMIMQSDLDFNCPNADAEMMYRYLLKNDVTARLVTYPREGHALSRSGEPKHVVDRLDRILSWFNGFSDYHDEGHPEESAEKEVRFQP